MKAGGRLDTRVGFSGMGTVARIAARRQPSTRSAVSGALSRILSSALAAPVRPSLALLPVADGLVRHVDAPSELDLGQPETPAHPAGEVPHVAHGLGGVVARLAGDVLLAGRIQHLMVDPSARKALRGCPDQSSTVFRSYARTSLRLALRAEIMRIVEPRIV